MLSFESLKKEQSAVIDDIASILSVSNSIAATLLIHFSWNKERLLDSYWKNPEDALAKAGAFHEQEEKKTGDAFLCKVFFTEYPWKETFSMCCPCPDNSGDPNACRFSLTAWQQYLFHKVNEGPGCVVAMCAHPDCKNVVPPATWNAVLGAPGDSPEETSKFKVALQMYNKHLLNSFVDINRSMKWCPSATCSNAILTTGAVSNVVCSCGNKFCFKCGRDAHAPIGCRHLKLWLDKCNDESETANWILANTKTAPSAPRASKRRRGAII